MRPLIAGECEGKNTIARRSLSSEPHHGLSMHAEDDSPAAPMHLPRYLTPLAVDKDGSIFVRDQDETKKVNLHLDFITTITSKHTAKPTFLEDVDNGAPTSTLCAPCQSISLTIASPQPHYGNVGEVEQSAVRGCSLCHQFWTHATHDLPDGGRDLVRRHEGCQGISEGFVHVNVNAQYGPRLLLRIAHPGDEDSEIGACAEYIVQLVPLHTPKVAMVSDADMAGSTRASLAQARLWLDRCEQSHESCKPTDVDFVPSRLVSTEEGAARLCLGVSLPRSTRYATLSHCWGAASFTTLRKGNLKSFMSSIPRKALSKTIKDALQIARRLGFAYVWIDTLCIIQDQPDDWKRESALMSLVYGGSSLNIAASGARNGNIGCFAKRPQHWRCRITDDINGELRAYEAVPNMLDYHPMEKMPLQERGWALQERLLPTRTLHFTQTEVVWECYHGSACETFPQGLHPFWTFFRRWFKKRPLDLSMWSWVVDQYSKCKLTYLEDKLVALSGVAKRLHTQTGDQYVAGMWRDGLENQLCWYTTELPRRRSAGGYMAPSWSWASLDAAVSSTGPKQRLRSWHNEFLWITILNIDLQPSGPDLFGQLASATLRVSCLALLHVTAVTYGHEGDTIIIDGEKLDRCSVQYDGQGLPSQYLREFDGRSDEMCHDVYALPVYGDSFTGGSITGLLLKPSRERAGTYERVGSFQFVGNESSTHSFDELAKGRHDKLKSDECIGTRTDEAGNPRYVIDLV